MFRAAIIFLILGLMAIALGAYNFAGLSIEAGKMILIAFLVLAFISFLASLVSGRNQRTLP